MNIQKEDYQGLLNQISSSTDKNFTEFQIISLVDAMQSLGWQGSQRIVTMAIRNKDMPRNVYGYILGLLEEEADRLEREVCQRNEWKAIHDCATPEEFTLTMKCISLISQFKNSSDLLKKFGDYLTMAQDKDCLLEALTRSFKFYSDLLNTSIHRENDSDLNAGI
jgi:hypothetical protein